MKTYFKTPLDAALYLAEKGFKLFPLRPNTKLPQVKNWELWAENSSKDRIKNFQIPNCNWAIACGPSDLTVIDLDNKEGIKGIDNLKALKQSVPKTLTIKTPSGGYHLYYKGALKTTASKIAKGIDTRGNGGYVVAPGSVINKRYYQITATNVIPKHPSWLPEKVNYQKELATISDNPEIEESTRNATLASLAGTMRSRGFGFDAIFAALQMVNEKQTENPLPNHEVKNIAKSISRYSPDLAETASDFIQIPKLTALKASDIDIQSIPKREWIMNGRYIANNISVLISPGGVGKSTLTVLDALSIVTGESFTGYTVPNKANVLLYGTEEPRDELSRKVAAAADYHNIPLESLEGLFIRSGRDDPLIMARSNAKGGIAINDKGIKALTEFIQDNKIKLFIADPFVRTHEVNENDNMAIDKVVWCFQRIAEKTKSSICLVHHARKAQGYGAVNGDQNQARGASSLINAARMAHTLSPMQKEEAIRLGIEENRKGFYVRLDSAKSNLSAPCSSVNWYEKVTVSLINGDNVGAITPMQFVTEEGEKGDVELNQEKEELKAWLDEHLEIGDKIAINSILDMAVFDNNYPALFKKNQLGKKQQKRWLVTIIGDELNTGCKKFVHAFLPEKRVKNYVECNAAK